MFFNYLDIHPFPYCFFFYLHIENTSINEKWCVDTRGPLIFTWTFEGQNPRSEEPLGWHYLINWFVTSRCWVRFMIWKEKRPGNISFMSLVGNRSLKIYVFTLRVVHITWHSRDVHTIVTIWLYLYDQINIVPLYVERFNFT